MAGLTNHLQDRQPNFAAAAAAHNGQYAQCPHDDSVGDHGVVGHVSGDSVKDVSPPSSPVMGGQQSLAKLLDSSVQSSPGLPQPGSYPHPAVGQPGQLPPQAGQINGGHTQPGQLSQQPNNLQDHLQQQKVNSESFTVQYSQRLPYCSRYQNLYPL